MNENPQHIEMQTPDGRQLAMDALAKVIPSCFTEAKGDDGELHQVVDFTKLRQLLGDAAVDDAPEVYDFTWVGKRAAMREAAAPIRKTLRPCPEESVDWDTTQNLYIEGDNLEVLKLLQNSYMGKVKMIYIDPPYNTGNDFVYHDDFHRTQQEEDEAAGIINESGEKMIRNLESNGKFHSDWCSMLYSRLMVARSFLKEDGIIFISIDDKEVDNLRKICNEVFGERNFVGMILWKKKTNGNNMGYLPPVHDYIVAYSKDLEAIKDLGYPITEEFLAKTFSNPDNDPRGPWTTSDLSANHKGPYFPIKNPETGEIHYPPKGRYWVFNESEVARRITDGRIIFGKNGNGRPIQKVFASSRTFGKIRAESWWDNKGMNADATAELLNLFKEAKLFTHPKPSKLLYNICKIASEKDSIIFDFFSGSATTADAIMQLNAEDKGTRRYLMVQLPEITDQESEAFKAGYKNICELGKERIRRAGKKIKEENPDAEDLDIGFRVFKCSDSNYKDVAFSPKDYSQEELDMFVDNIKDDRTDLDLLFDCMLRWGVELSMPLKSTKVDGCTIHNVDDGNLVACFDGVVTEKVIDAIAAMSPVRVVFRDSSFTEAAAKMNLFELFKQKCNWTEEEVRKNVRVI